MYGIVTLCDMQKISARLFFLILYLCTPSVLLLLVLIKVSCVIVWGIIIILSIHDLLKNCFKFSVEYFCTFSTAKIAFRKMNKHFKST